MELSFVTGSGIRRVFINGRKVSIVSAELGFQPLEFDLDMLEDAKTKDIMKKQKFTKQDLETLKDLAKLGSEDAIAKDITKDFQAKGWRLIKKSGTN